MWKRPRSRVDSSEVDQMGPYQVLTMGFYQVLTLGFYQVLTLGFYQVLTKWVLPGINLGVFPRELTVNSPGIILGEFTKKK